MRRISPLIKRATYLTVVLLIVLVILILKDVVHTPRSEPPKPQVNITTTLPPRRNADTLTLYYAAQSQEADRVHIQGWRKKVLKNLGLGKNHRIPINLPEDLSIRDWNDLDLMKIPQFEFLPNFKNPCWRESYRPKHTCHPRWNTGNVRKRYPVDYLRCLPYFYMIGQPKSGTTDVYRRLNKHPDVVAPGMKESFWLERLRFNSQCSSINNYVDIQHRSTVEIRSSGVYNQTGHFYHQKITGDGTVDVMWDNALWPLLPGNEGCSEPCVTNADIVHHLNPEAKIIVCFRNPVDRVYSDFLYEAHWLHYNISKDHFHYQVTKEIGLFKTCLKTNSPRACVYNGAHENSITSKIRLRQGLYSIHLADWLRVFPLHQVHVIRFEDYIHNTEQEMKRLFRFLDLRELSKKEMVKVLDVEATNKRKKTNLAMGDMHDKTKVILQEFYKEYNEQLAALLDDTRFLWD